MWRDTNIELVKQLWADEMGKLSNDDLRRGYGALMSRDWPPSLPEFIKLCRPTIDPTVAYYEAVAGMQARERGEVGKWSHPAIFWAAVQISAFDLKNQSVFADQGALGKRATGRNGEGPMGCRAAAGAPCQPRAKAICPGKRRPRCWPSWALPAC
jgi:hypothetical protein